MESNQLSHPSRATKKFSKVIHIHTHIMYVYVHTYTHIKNLHHPKMPPDHVPGFNFRSLDHDFARAYRHTKAELPET